MKKKDINSHCLINNISIEYDKYKSINNKIKESYKES